ncbi:hypothetical protein R1flu_023582 [Riccia fluitans]|uniref:Uncharacterized protein n=1 Tax=Riccia fluitans TaxID=41844 RepID=A0ABD1XSX9_9MARC
MKTRECERRPAWQGIGPLVQKRTSTHVDTDENGKGESNVRKREHSQRQSGNDRGMHVGALNASLGAENDGMFEGRNVQSSKRRTNETRTDCKESNGKGPLECQACKQSEVQAVHASGRIATSWDVGVSGKQNEGEVRPFEQGAMQMKNHGANYHEGNAIQ